MAGDGVQINGVFEKWVLFILAGLVVTGVGAGVVMAIQQGRILEKTGNIERQITEMKADFKDQIQTQNQAIRDNDRRLDSLERDVVR